jgi:hypothetical protein
VVVDPGEGLDAASAGLEKDAGSDAECKEKGPEALEVSNERVYREASGAICLLATHGCWG